MSFLSAPKTNEESGLLITGKLSLLGHAQHDNRRMDNDSARSAGWQDDDRCAGKVGMTVP